MDYSLDLRSMAWWPNNLMEAHVGLNCINSCTQSFIVVTLAMCRMLNMLISRFCEI